MPLSTIKATFAKHFNYAVNGQRRSYNGIIGTLFGWANNTILTQKLVGHAETLQRNIASSKNYSTLISTLTESIANVYYERILFKKRKGFFEHELMRTLDKVITALSASNVWLPASQQQANIAVLQLKALKSRMEALPYDDMRVKPTQKEGFINFFQDFLRTGTCGNQQNPQYGEHSLYNFSSSIPFSFEDGGTMFSSWFSYMSEQDPDGLEKALSAPMYKGKHFGGPSYLSGQHFDALEPKVSIESQRVTLSVLGSSTLPTDIVIKIASFHK